jgi:hypothetical protein
MIDKQAIANYLKTIERMKKQYKCPLIATKNILDAYAATCHLCSYYAKRCAKYFLEQK